MTQRAGPAGPRRERDVRGVPVPLLIYGTAWKEDATARLTGLALDAGFRGIDTANQRRHYLEAGVGEALRDAMAAGDVARGDLFLQSKFTYARGQDHRLPYDPAAPVAKQVEQSFASSLKHLGVDRLDAYLLHGPAAPVGLTAEDREAWGAMEDLARARKTRLIGVSNASFDQLRELTGEASMKPAIVQNRCFTRPRADRDVRAFCAEHGLLYQGFSLLTAAPTLLAHRFVVDVAKRLGATPAQVVFASCLREGMAVLTGTTSAEHMRQDLDVQSLELGPDEAEALARLVSP